MRRQYSVAYQLHRFLIALRQTYQQIFAQTFQTPEGKKIVFEILKAISCQFPYFSSFSEEQNFLILAWVLPTFETDAERCELPMNRFIINQNVH